MHSNIVPTQMYTHSSLAAPYTVSKQHVHLEVAEGLVVANQFQLVTEGTWNAEVKLSPPETIGTVRALV